MANVVRGGDLCGGAIIASSQILVNGLPVATAGNAVVSHGSSPHDAATLVAGGNIRANGLSIAGQGSLATCGDSCIASQGNVRISGNT